MNARQAIGPPDDPQLDPNPDSDPVARVAAWRARGAAEADPVGFGVTEALARRAAAVRGVARGLMIRRIEQRLADHVAGSAGSPGAAAASAPADGLAALRALVDRLTRGAAQPQPAPQSPGSADQGPLTPEPRPLNAVAAYKGTWSRLRAEQRLRQALAQVPSMAGPLNSSQVVHRALQAIHELSPAYLDAFMAHVDTLLWLEQASGGDLPVRAAPRSAKPRRTRATPG